MARRWIDLLDPTARGARAARSRATIHDDALELLLAPLVHDDEPRPAARERTATTSSASSSSPSRCRRGRRVYYQEIDFVADARSARHGARRRRPAALRSTRASRRRADRSEPRRDDRLPPRRRRSPRRTSTWSTRSTTRSTSSRTTSRAGGPRRSARAISDAAPRPAPHPPHARPDARRASTASSTAASSSTAQELFPHEVELAFADAYDKLLRAVDGLELRATSSPACATTSSRRSRTTRTR